MDNLPSTPFFRLLYACLQADVMPACEGVPGLGKSAICAAIARANDCEFIQMTGSSKSEVDYQGLMFDNNGYTGYLPMDWTRRANEANRALVLLDEFNNTSEEVMRCNHMLVEEHIVGETKLADTVRLIAVYNPLEDSTSGIPIPVAVANRMCHLKWEADVDLWAQGMVHGFANVVMPTFHELAPYDANMSAMAHSRIAMFVQHHPQFASEVPTDMDARSGAWPSLRTWEKLARVLAYVRPTDTAVFSNAVKGLVGNTAARPFITWWNEQDSVNPAQAIADPSLMPWDGRVDRFSLAMSSVVAYTRQSQHVRDWKRACNIAVYGMEQTNKEDLATIAANMLLSAMPRDADMPEKFRDAFTNLLVSAGMLTAAH